MSEKSKTGSQVAHEAAEAMEIVGNQTSRNVKKAMESHAKNAIAGQCPDQIARQLWVDAFNSWSDFSGQSDPAVSAADHADYVVGRYNNTFYPKG